MYNVTRCLGHYTNMKVLSKFGKDNFIFNQFLVNIPNLYFHILHFIAPEKTKNSLFSGVFRGDKKQKLTRNISRVELEIEFALINLKRLTKYLKTESNNCFHRVTLTKVAWTNCVFVLVVSSLDQFLIFIHKVWTANYKTNYLQRFITV